MQNDQLEDLVSAAAIAEKLGIPTGSLSQMRYLGTGPKYIKVGARVRYRMSDVETWLGDRVRTQTGPA